MARYAHRRCMRGATMKLTIIDSTIQFWEEDFYKPGFGLDGNLSVKNITAPPPNNSTYNIIEFKCPRGTSIITMNDTHYVCESGKGVSIINGIVQPKPKPIRTVHCLECEEIA